jgi:DNA-directed RNA polymerase subunit RPC12/RpoP
MLARCARCGRKLPRKGAEHVAGAGVLCRRCAVKVTGADAGEVRQ